MKPNTKELLVVLLRSIGWIMLHSFGLWLAVSILIGLTTAGSSDEEMTLRFNLIYAAFPVVFPFAVYRAYVKPDAEEYLYRRRDREGVPVQNLNLNWQADLRAYWQMEGKIFFLLCASLAVIIEIISYTPLGVAVTTFFSFFFPFLALLQNVPVLRAVVSLAYTALCVAITTFLGHKKAYKKYKKDNGYYQN